MPSLGGAGAYGIFLLPLEVANDAVRGDLSSTDAVAFRVSLFWAGRVVGVLSGPPCETWSQARHHKVAARRHPRPLRLADALRGLRYLKDREREQVTMGTSLVRAQATLLFLAAVMCPPGLAESTPERAG